MTPLDQPISIRGLDFFMCLTQDMKRARSFYESLFSLKAGPVDSEHFVEYDLPDGATFALAQDPSAERSPTGGAVFGVSDAEAAIARIEALGGKLLKCYGGAACTSGWCLDPEGNSFGVHQRKG